MAEITKFNETLPYCPVASKFMFHKLLVLNPNGSTEEYICSKYYVKEDLLTMFDCREKTGYFDTETNILPEIKFYYDHHLGYRESSFDPHTSTEWNNHFSVDGYAEIPCRTIPSARIIKADSFEICKDDDESWYTIDKDSAIEFSRIGIERHNDRIALKNEKIMSKDSLSKEYSKMLGKAQDEADRIVDALHERELYEYDCQIRKINENWNKKWWIIRLFSKKPTPPAPPVRQEPEVCMDFVCEFVNSIKRIDKNPILGIDLTAMNQVFGVCPEEDNEKSE